MARSLLAVLLIAGAAAFQARVVARPATSLRVAEPGFVLELDLDAERSLKTSIRRSMADSSLIVAKYPLPFFIDIEATKTGNIVTKDGSEQKNNGAERVGDRLRGFTYYAVSQDSGGGGPASMFASFGGLNVKMTRQLYDATMVPWDKALEMLMTNEPRRTDEVIMIFERPAPAAPAARPAKKSKTALKDKMQAKRRKT
mmetsp:Transcript_15313/g.53373  ORF Transcript_15313/g.53373 Transcript_15313/m.53373 type:complete len:199 (-) Transcript_15313:221-817(-)